MIYKLLPLVYKRFPSYACVLIAKLGTIPDQFCSRHFRSGVVKIKSIVRQKINSRFATISTDDLNLQDQRKTQNRLSERSREAWTCSENFLAKKMSFWRKQKMAKALWLFFASVRKQDGEDLKKSSLHSLKYGLTKYIKEHCGIDCENCEEFA